MASAIPQHSQDVDVLNKVIELNLLTQDEVQMVQFVKRHHFENSLIGRQLSAHVDTLMRNSTNVIILCQGDSVYEQQLTKQVVEAKTVLAGIRGRIAPMEVLKERLIALHKTIEKLTSDQQDEEMGQRRIQNRAEELEAEHAERQKELDKLNDSMKFKEAVHKHLKKNLEQKKQHITRWKAISEELQQKHMKESQDLKLEQERKQKQIDKLSLQRGRLCQQLAESQQRVESERSRSDTQILDWRERTRQATQRRNDVFDTWQKGEMETRLYQSHMQRHADKLRTQQRRADARHNELLQTQLDIQETRAKIQEYTAVPESYINTVRQLTTENTDLQLEISQLAKDEAEAREQAVKLKAELDELESLDGLARRKKMERQQRALRDSLEKIDAAVTAAESSYTCFECLKAVKTPMTFVPCGHSVCRHHGKHSDDMLICPECKAECDTVFANLTIPELLSKLQFLDSLISTVVES
jgi:DNA repair exonuclease SbcCD ATPase subunit